MSFLKPKPTDETAFILEKNFCADCGWPIVKAMVNDEFENYPPAKEETWFIYCTNKGCKNHEGCGVYYEWPKWCKTAGLLFR
jgi:hypothetical protein